MGCGGSSFPKDTQKFLTGHRKQKKEVNNLVEVQEDNCLTFNLKKGLWQAKDASFTSKLSTGEELVTIKYEDNRAKCFNPAGKEIACFIDGQRGSMINGNETLIELPHIYIYSFNQFLDGTSPADIKVDGNPLYYWARIHREDRNTYEVCVPTFKDTSKEKRDMFSVARLTAKNATEGISFKREDMGAALCLTDEGDPNSWKISTAPHIDSVLVLLTVMAIEELTAKPSPKK